MHIFGEFIPLPIFLMLCAIYGIGLIWGWRGPRRYRRDRFFPMKGMEPREELEDVTAGELFDEGLTFTHNGSIPGYTRESARRDVFFHFRPAGTTTGATWSHYLADAVRISQMTIDYARVAKMLGVINLELSPGWRMWPLRFLSHYLLFFLYVFAVGFMPLVITLEHVGDQPYDPSPPWELLAVGGYMILFYMMARLIVETVQYAVQLRRSKKIVNKLSLFNSRETVQTIYRYLHRQLGCYVVSYATLIIIVFALLSLVEPPYGIDW
ncbi:hypothetical protein [Alkalicoccus luteus]|uniref:Uncharacterized protein n=1 Tax=Alkalicoccus luteus TaxID=1237094 RepID=A0A969TWC9_9BACI|nr:hypothetical protein [Alkalicoccus luteus]NJP39067.1 hypothetical protein [Alkalicoccus luteus]